MRILGKVEYNGTSYKGWQRQSRALSIQEAIEDVLSRILNNPIKIYGSGRTDSGVHALGQCFHFDIAEDKYDLKLLRHSMNILLPHDIKIISFAEVDSSFDARKDVKSKVYQYRFSLGEVSVFERPFIYRVRKKVDLELLKSALALFVGKHNFASFTSKKEDENNFIRTIHSIDFLKEDDKVTLTFKGGGFMKYMIRYIVGVSLAVATGKTTIEKVEHLLKSEAREVTSFKSPAYGLILMDVVY